MMGNQDVTGASADADQALAVPATPANAVDGPPSFDPSRGDLWDAVRAAAPKQTVRERLIEVEVVAKRCVYVNDYRVAGGKPYVSEQLPSHIIKTSVGDVLDAFTDKEIRAALREAKAMRNYYAAIHAANAIAMEARRAATPKSDAAHDSAGPQDIAQQPPPSR